MWKIRITYRNSVRQKINVSRWFIFLPVILFFLIKQLTKFLEQDILESLMSNNLHARIKDCKHIICVLVSWVPEKVQMRCVQLINKYHHPNWYWNCKVTFINSHKTTNMNIDKHSNNNNNNNDNNSKCTKIKTTKTRVLWCLQKGFP